METTIILCFITYLGFEIGKFGAGDASKLFGVALLWIGLLGLIGRLLGNLF